MTVLWPLLSVIRQNEAPHTTPSKLPRVTFSINAGGLLRLIGTFQSVCKEDDEALRGG